MSDPPKDTNIQNPEKKDIPSFNPTQFSKLP